ncbi:MAG: sensor histidine kinase [Burkholderiales bacterium]|nr:sensor histidine kinase [Burkholderiales bacterium]
MKRARFWPLAVLLAAVALAAGAQAPDITQPIVFERAEFLESRSSRIPPEDAPWKPVRLPDNWHESRPGYSGIGWYRIELPPTTATRRVHLVHVSRDSADLIRFFLNGHIVGSTQRPDPSLRLYQQPYATGMMGGTLREGKNTLHILVEGHSNLRHGLPRVWFGDSVPIRAMWLERYRLHVLLPMGCAFAVLAMGLIALAFWSRNRRDPQFLWTGLAATLIGAPALLHFFIGPGASGVGRDVLQLFYAYGAAPALAMSGLHVARVERRGQAWLLWGLLAVGCAAPLLLGPLAFVRVSSALGAVFLLILVGVFTLVLLRGGQHTGWIRGIVAASLAAVIAFAVHDLALWMGWIGFDRIALSAFSAPVLALALGALVISRHLEAVGSLANANVTLEQRVADRTAEIERTHKQLRGLEQERARVAERQRIMADIHDGLGASLVSLLSVVQTRRAEPAEVEHRVHEALQELRLAVDSQDTLEGDLLTALATIRFRMRDALEAAGIALEWDITDIPRLDHLSSRNLLGIQRIVLEALTNAIRHAQASSVSVSLVAAADHIAVLISDNGRGFDAAAQVHVGRGLSGMRRRATETGGTLRIESAAGRGTRVTLTLPLQPPASNRG